MVHPASLFSVLFLTIHLSISVTFTIVNQCNYTVWPASLTTKNGSGDLSTTGFILRPGQNSTVTAPLGWSGRFWGRTHCTTSSTTGDFSCLTGDCGAKGPATLAEFAVNSVNNKYFYDVSLIDGYNIPMTIVPTTSNCTRTGCPADLNAVCPTELQVTKNETVVACQGPCATSNLQNFCCSGNQSSPSSCQPSSYVQLFKTVCPQAYSYVYGDQNSTLTCPPTDYGIPFCPASNNTSQESLDQGVNVGDLLTAGKETQWLSSSGDFAFRFYKLPNELFLLAIWYDKIPNKTIIWHANGDNPAPIGSRLELNDSHGLVLNNPQGLELWRSDFTSSKAFTGLMNDSGNFQLLNNNLETLWDTFSHPTDTLVPGQVLELNGTLSSQQGEFNFSHGRFKLHLQEDGNIVFNLINFPSNYSYDPYYSTRTSDVKNQTNVGHRLIFDESGFLFLVYREKKWGEDFYQ